MTTDFIFLSAPISPISASPRRPAFQTKEQNADDPKNSTQMTQIWQMNTDFLLSLISVNHHNQRHQRSNFLSALISTISVSPRRPAFQFLLTCVPIRINLRSIKKQG
jgi:ADP-glucose pyrophosphorylase